MGCLNITKAFVGSTCKNNMAGIKTLWVGPEESIKNIEPAYPNDGSDPGMIVKVDDGNGASPVLAKFYRFPLPIDIGDFVEDATADPKIGTSFVNITINGTILGLEHASSGELSKMIQGKQAIIAELYDGKYVYLGEANFLDITGGGSRSGAEAASLQGYEMTWTGKEPHYARFVDSATVVVTGDELTVGL